MQEPGAHKVRWLREMSAGKEGPNSLPQVAGVVSGFGASTALKRSACGPFRRPKLKLKADSAILRPADKPGFSALARFEIEEDRKWIRV